MLPGHPFLNRGATPTLKKTEKKDNCITIWSTNQSHGAKTLLISLIVPRPNIPK